MIEAGILNGDYVIVRQQSTANNGEIVVAMTEENEATVKRFFKETDCFRLQPENSHAGSYHSKKCDHSRKSHWCLPSYSLILIPIFLSSQYKKAEEFLPGQNRIFRLILVYHLFKPAFFLRSCNRFNPIFHFKFIENSRNIISNRSCLYRKFICNFFCIFPICYKF